MIDNLCSICLKRISHHSIEQVKYCQEKFQLLEIERHANEECCNCGCSSDLRDPSTGMYWCNSCMAWRSQLNDEGSK